MQLDALGIDKIIKYC